MLIYLITFANEQHITVQCYCFVYCYSWNQQKSRVFWFKVEFLLFSHILCSLKHQSDTHTHTRYICLLLLVYIRNQCTHTVSVGFILTYENLMTRWLLECHPHVHAERDTVLFSINDVNDGGSHPSAHRYTAHGECVLTEWSRKI